MRSTTSERLSNIAVLTIACWLWGLVLYWVPANLHMHLGRDQGIFAWVGTVILKGGLPYADAWEVKGPMVHFLYAVAIALFGHREQSIRILDLLIWLFASGVFLYISRTVTRSVIPGLLCAPLLLGLSRADYWETAQPDLWAGILLLASFALNIGTIDARKRYWACGVLIASATLIKPVYILYLIVPAGAIIWGEAEERRRSAGYLLLGAAIPAIAVLLIYAGAHQIPALMDVLIRFNLGVHRTQQHPFSVSSIWQALSRQMAPFPNGNVVLLIELIALIGVADVFKAKRKVAVLGICSWLLSIVFVVAQNKFYVYHFLPVWTFTTLFAGFGMAAVLRFPAVEPRLAPALKWAVSIVCAVWLCLGAVDSVKPQADKYWDHRPGSGTEAMYESGFCIADFCHRDLTLTAQFIKSRTRPTDKVYLWGFDALLYFLSDRQAPTRYGFNYPLIVDSERNRDQERRELIRGLCANPPVFIVVQKKDANNLYEKSSDQNLKQFPLLESFIQERYAPQMTNQHFIAYGLSSPHTASVSTICRGVAVD